MKHAYLNKYMIDMDFYFQYIIQAVLINAFEGCDVSVPEQLNKTFETQLSLRNIPVHQHSYFHKWLRCYLDFCTRYCLNTQVSPLNF